MVRTPNPIWLDGASGYVYRSETFYVNTGTDVSVDEVSLVEGIIPRCAA